MDWRYKQRLSEIAEQERRHLEESSMQHANLCRSKLKLREMEGKLEQAKIAVQCKELRQLALKVFADDENACQIKLAEIAEMENRHQLEVASLYERQSQADLEAMDAEEMVRQTKLMAQYEKIRQATQAAFAFTDQSPKRENPTMLSQVYGKLRDLVPEPVRSAVPTFSSSLGMVDSKMTKTIDRELHNLSDNWNQEPISNKQRMANTLNNVGLPLAYHSARFLLDPARKEEFSKNQYDYDEQFDKTLNPEIKEHFINLDRFKNESLGNYQNWRNQEPERTPHDKGFQTPTIPIIPTIRF